MLPVIIGIDPALKSSGISIWTEGRCIGAMLIDLMRHSDMEISAMLLAKIRTSPVIVYCEKPYSRRGPVEAVAIWTRIMHLAHMQQALIGKCEVPWTIYQVFPGTWRSRLALPQHGDTRKHSAVEMAKGMTDWEGDDHNVAEAICIGLLAVNETDQERINYGQIKV